MCVCLCINCLNAMSLLQMRIFVIFFVFKGVCENRSFQYGWTCLKCDKSDSLKRQLNPHKWHLNGYVMVFLSIRPKRWYETTSLCFCTSPVVDSILTCVIDTSSLLWIFVVLSFMSVVEMISKCSVIVCCLIDGTSIADSIIIVLYWIMSERKKYG